MNKGKSTGGRPPYEPDERDFLLAQKLAEKGCSHEVIANALDISKRTLYALMERDKDFLHRIKKGVVEHFLDCEEKVTNNQMSPTAFIYFSKTKWKHFYPQEDREVQPQKVEVNLTDEQSMKILEIAGQDGAPV